MQYHDGLLLPLQAEYHEAAIPANVMLVVFMSNFQTTTGTRDVAAVQAMLGMLHAALLAGHTRSSCALRA